MSVSTEKAAEHRAIHGNLLSDAPGRTGTIPRGADRARYYGSDYKDMNARMRAGRTLTPQQRAILADMDAHATEFGEDVLLFRGMDLRRPLAVGDEISMASPTSTSTSLRIADVKSYGDTIVEVHGARRSRVLIENAAEGEVVLMPGGKEKGIDDLNQYVVAVVQ